MLTRVYIQSELLPDIKFIEINADYAQLETASFEQLWEMCRADPWQRPADKLSLRGRGRWSAIAAKPQLPHRHAQPLAQPKYALRSVPISPRTAEEESNPALPRIPPCLRDSVVDSCCSNANANANAITQKPKEKARRFKAGFWLPGAV